MLEPGAALPAVVGPKVPPVADVEPAAEAVEPAAELNDDCSGCRTAAGQGQGRQHLLAEEVLEPRPAEEPRAAGEQAAGEQRHATGWQGRVQRDRRHRQRRLSQTRQAPPRSASAERLR